MSARGSRTSASIPSPTLLEREHRAGVLILTLARPDARNSLSQAMIEALQGAIKLPEVAGSGGQVRTSAIIPR